MTELPLQQLENVSGDQNFFSFGKDELHTVITLFKGSFDEQHDRRDGQPYPGSDQNLGAVLRCLDMCLS